LKIATGSIRAGICGFCTKVRAEGDDKYHVSLQVTSDCEKVQRFGSELGTVSVFDELQQGYDGAILSAARSHLKGCCAACIVPAGVFKTMQVAGAVALPAEVAINLQLES
jgi:hypothetical protein